MILADKNDRIEKKGRMVTGGAGGAAGSQTGSPYPNMGGRTQSVHDMERILQMEQSCSE
ncbi:MAG: hypothetical protein V8Q42_10870 [Anaerovoracaceae bacterium]